MKQANELVKVAVNVIPPLAGPGLQYRYRPLPGQGTHTARVSSLPCWHSQTHTHRHTHTQKKRKKRQKVRGRERGVNMYCTTAALLYNIHYIKSLSGSWKKEKRCVNRGDTVFSRF